MHTQRVINREGLLAALDGSVIIAATDVAGTITEVNKAFCAITGYGREELIGANHRILNSGHHPKEFWVQMWKVIARGGVWRAEVCNRNKQGSLYWVDTTIGPVRDESGKLCGYVSVRVDITARKRGAVAVVENEAKLRTLFECSPVGIALSDHATGLCIQGNDVLCEILGYTADQLRHVSFREITPLEYADLENAQWERLRTHGAYGPYEKEFIRADGTRVPVSVHGSLVKGGDGRRMVWSIVQDISQQKRVEAELSWARDVAQAANRAKDDFLANMSHEIRTPMTAILGYAELLRDESEAPRSAEARAEIIDTINAAGRHLLGIINDILDLSTIETGRTTIERAPVPLARLLREVEGILRPGATAKGLSLALKIGSPLPETILTDPTRLRQMLLNVAGNAVKFTQDGGVTLEARTEAGLTGERLVIDVLDTGSGVAPEHVPDLFEPFMQADHAMTRQHGGAGLGLPVSRRIARLMEGDVTLAWTSVGKGSCFRIELPLVAAVAPAGAELGPTSTPATSTSPALKLSGRILLAEDGVDNQRLISLHLRKAGAQVDIAENGRIALEMLDRAVEAGTPYGMLLTDMQMPEMDGYTLARTLRTRGEGTPPHIAAYGRSLAVVALTAHAMAEDRDKCLAAGCDDYSTKPIDKARLIAICGSWIGKQGGQGTLQATGSGLSRSA